MRRLSALFTSVLCQEDGQDLIEYTLLATFVALVAIVGATSLGKALNNWYGATAGGVDTAAAGAS